MTLLADELSIAASNNPFLTKNKKYKHSNILLTSQLVSNYSSFGFKQVGARSQELAKNPVRIWSV
ncbi:MAG: hypothetical protein JW384_01440 [Nitrosomonadaceae bacterium]|nr:hypothetical protein [Nitrosomonadaceae bacterium]